MHDVIINLIMTVSSSRCCYVLVIGVVLFITLYSTNPEFWSLVVWHIAILAETHTTSYVRKSGG